MIAAPLAAIGRELLAHVARGVQCDAPDVCVLAGVVAIVIGCGLAWRPLGFIIAGVALILLGVRGLAPSAAAAAVLDATSARLPALDSNERPDPRGPM